MLLTIKDVAERLQISPSHANALAKRGDLPSYRIGSCRRVSEQDLERFLEQNRDEPTDLPASTNRHF